ncbi:hypothetical protein AYI70_g2952 [Smittium culicis]|uniref:Uncharacterized protein n=1 Tax=Smittium culicis TaxID=133412 RepID=A0A1R1Y5S3_9FUNG|nr:hypothetical protein AYI70_g9815 [Smittium culicis]OMJ22331.1 hypothetical protein AYI70_g2952 [Smittium culicis]
MSRSVSNSSRDDFSTSNRDFYRRYRNSNTSNISNRDIFEYNRINNNGEINEYLHKSKTIEINYRHPFRKSLETSIESDCLLSLEPTRLNNPGLSSSLKFSYPPKPLEISEGWLDISKDEFSLDPDSDFTLLSNPSKINSIPSLPAIPIPQNNNKNFHNSKKTKNRILSNSHSSDYTSKKMRIKKKSNSGTSSQIKKNKIENLRNITAVAIRDGSENSDSSYSGPITKPDSKFSSPDHIHNLVPVQKIKYDSLDEQLQESFKYLEPNNVHSGTQKDLSNENSSDRTLNNTKENNINPEYYKMSGESNLAEMKKNSPKASFTETKIKIKKSKKLEKLKNISQATENTYDNNDMIKEAEGFISANTNKSYADDNSPILIDKLYDYENVKDDGEQEKINSSFESITLKNGCENFTSDKDNSNKDSLNIKENTLHVDNSNLLDYNTGRSNKGFPEEPYDIATEAENKIPSITVGANKTAYVEKKILDSIVQSGDEIVSSPESNSAYIQPQKESHEAVSASENDEFSNKSQIAIHPSREDLLNFDHNSDNRNVSTDQMEEPPSCPAIKHRLEDDKPELKNDQNALYKPSSDYGQASDADVPENHILGNVNLIEVEVKESGGEIAHGNPNSGIETEENISSVTDLPLTLDDISDQNFKNKVTRSTRSSARVAAATAAAKRGDLEETVIEFDHNSIDSNTNFSNENSNTIINDNRKDAIDSTHDSNVEIPDIATSEDICKNKKGISKAELGRKSSVGFNEGFSEKLAGEVAEISADQEILNKSDTIQSAKDINEIKQDKDKNSSISNSKQKKSPKSKSKKKKSGKR